MLQELPLATLSCRENIMKKSLLLVIAAIFAFAVTSCATTSSADSSSSSETASSKSTSDEKSTTAKETAINALTGAGKNTWYKKVSGDYIYYILYSDSAVTSGVRSDVTINKGLTIVATTTSKTTTVNGLNSSNFAIKSFGQTTTESGNGSSQTFTLNDGAWSYFYTKNSESMTALSSLPDQLKSANASKYSILTGVNFNWKQILIDYLEGTL